MTYQRKEVLGDGVELYLGDCRDVMPALGPVDAVVSDPPYGLGDKMQGGTWGANPAFGDMLVWDASPLAGEALKTIMRCAPAIILWGGAILRPSTGAMLADLEQAQLGAHHG